MITHEIIGDDMQAVELRMAAGDQVRAENPSVDDEIDFHVKRDFGGPLGAIGDLNGGDS